MTSTYRYDGAGERIVKQVGTGDVQVYLLDGVTPVAVATLSSAGAFDSAYFNLVWENRVVGRQPATGSRKYYYMDILGSTRAVATGATITETYDYDAWGVLMAARTLADVHGLTKEGFGSKERDAETGMDYFGARYYTAALGRWATTDPAEDGTPGWSTYSYVADNPASLIDPNGLSVGSCGEGCTKFTGEDVPLGLVQARAISHQRGPGRGSKPGHKKPAPHKLCDDVPGESLGECLVAWPIATRLGLESGSGEFVLASWALVASTVDVFSQVPPLVGLEEPAALESGSGVPGTDEAPPESEFGDHWGVPGDIESILQEGLRPGSWATPKLGLSPLQANIELALDQARGFRTVTIRIDLAALRRAGYRIPPVTRVTGWGTQGMAGGGWEMRFPYRIEPRFLHLEMPKF